MDDTGNIDYCYCVAENNEEYSCEQSKAFIKKYSNSPI